MEFEYEFSVFPNPLTSGIKINFTLGSDQQITIEVVYVVGKVSKILVKKLLTAGSHFIYADLGNLPEGIYFCRIQLGNQMLTKKIIKVN